MIDVGGLVGNYRVLAKLGEGSMGNVFFAQHPVIGRNAAIKVIAPEYARNADMVSRFVDEARSLQQIGHEHIVEITDFGRTVGDELYLVMEYLEGEPLSAWIARRNAPNVERSIERSLAIATQIADALVASHAQHIIHRDLKPDNVILVARGGNKEFVKVLDFGVAKRSHTFRARETRPGTIMGTPMYMAPEQCEGCAEVDERADIYALGVVLFEMLTGQTPFKGETIADVVIQKTTLEAPSAASLAPELPASLDAVLRRALARDPSRRFPSMQAFRQALTTTEVATEFAGEVTHRVAPAKRGLLNVTWRVNGGKRFRPAPMALVIAAVAASALVAVGFPAASLRARADAAVQTLSANDLHGSKRAPAAAVVPRTTPVIVNMDQPAAEPSPAPVAEAAEPAATPEPPTHSSALSRRHVEAARRSSLRRHTHHEVTASDETTSRLDEDDILPPSFK